MGIIEELTHLIPGNPSDEIRWDKIGPLFAGTGLPDLNTVPQDPIFHGEGDVYTHTQMVCRELVREPAFHELPDRQRTELFLAAILHDIGKGRTTKQEGGVWVSPHHASTGSRIARTFLWRDHGLCGTEEAVIFRETVCALIRWHMLPVHLTDQPDMERKARNTASVGKLAKDFSWDLLCMLSEADVKGRIADDIGHMLSRVQLSRMLAEEAGCLRGPYRFPDRFTEHAYLSGRNVPPDLPLYDDTWGEVIMLSGLPGTGKDTWISQNYPDMPAVSLDELRGSLGIRQGDDQGEVIQAAQELAKGYLRKKQPFIWNATDLLRETRQQLIGLFERYGAGVRIVYLETDRESRIERNSRRKGAVPETAVSRMLEQTVPPMPDEARTVEWLCI